MAILERLKSLLGLDDAGSERQDDRDVGVTVERESGRSDESSDDAATETDAAESTDSTTGVDETTTAPDEAAEPETAETTERTADEAATETDAASERETDDEPGDLPIDEAEAEETEPDDSEADSDEPDETEPEDTAAAETDSSGSQDDEPVDVIKGIGPAYADRLEDAGVETVGNLATADADELAEEADISATRIQGWIDRAKVR